MKNIRILAAFCALLVAHSHPAAAAYVTGNDLLAECESKKSEDIYGCMNYVAGVIDFQLMQQSLGTEPSVDFCLPDKLTIEQASVTVMLYLRRSKELGSFIAAPSVPMALHEAYPCRAPVAHKKHHHG